LNKILIALTVVLCSALAGCQEVRNQEAGGLVGGALGGLLGAQIGSGKGKVVAAVTGALVGAHLGSNVGRSMDELDRLRAQKTLEATPTGQTTSWQNPDSGTRYAVTPTRTFSKSDAPCRDFVTDAWIDGQRESIEGTACRDGNGNWRVI